MRKGILCDLEEALVSADDDALPFVGDDGRIVEDPTIPELERSNSLRGSRIRGLRGSWGQQDSCKEDSQTGRNCPCVKPSHAAYL